ncbi:MAG: hypothetical protein ACTSV2_03715 [Candidatus Thorarchaeota archaeon]
MNKETESDRFGRLASENPELLYEAIETSDEPWWGFAILTQKRMDEYRDEDRTRELILMRSQDMLDYLRSRSDPWIVTWGMQEYTWFLEQNETIEAIAAAVRISKYSWQIFEILQYNRTIMKNRSLRDAFIFAISVHETPANIINSLRYFPDLLIEPKTIKVIVNAIETSDEFWWVISEVASIPVLTRQHLIEKAVERRESDLVEVFRSHPENWRIIHRFINLDEFMKESKVVDAIAQGLLETEDAANFLRTIWTSYALMNNDVIQKTIAQRLEVATQDELWQLLAPLKYRRILIESKHIRTVIEKRMDSIVKLILESESPVRILDEIGMLRFLTDDPRIIKAIRQRLPDIVKELNSEGIEPSIVWSFIENTIWIDDIYRNQEIRKGLTTSFIKNDTYAGYTKRLDRYDDLLHDPIIKDAIVNEMNNSSNPSWFIGAILDMPGLKEDKRILSEIEKLVPVIVKHMDDDEDSDDLIVEISTNKSLMSFKEIETVVINKIRSSPIPWKIIAGLPVELFFQDFVQDIIRENLLELSKAIWNERIDDLDWFMTGIYRSKIVNDSQAITESLGTILQKMIDEIENWYEVWYVLSSIDEIPFFFENTRILEAIQKRATDIAHSIKIRGDYWHIINVVCLFDELRSNEQIIESIIYQLETSYNPWEFLHTETLDSLLQNKRIRKELEGRIPDFVYGITHTIDAHEIVEKVEKVDFLRDDIRIQKAIHEFRTMAG